MNSINLFILKNDTESASNYLTKFSRLIRLILNNSQAKSIPLSQELESLRLYIQMEKLRFRQEFEFESVVSPDIQEDQVFIPPMIIQPYIENAIWHGLMHQEKEGRLKLSIRKAGSHLQCEIEDNGIGRAAATEMKKKSPRKRKSFGMELTKTRMDLTNKLYKIEGNVTIVDLVLPDGTPGGTLVKLKIPILKPDNNESSDH